MSTTFRVIYILLLCMGITLSDHISAQEIKEKKWSPALDSTVKSIGLTVKVDIAGPVSGLFLKWSSYGLGIEKSLSKVFSIVMTGTIGKIFTNGDFMETTYNEHLNTIQLGARYYFDNSKKFKGCFLGLCTYYTHDNILQTNPAETFYPPLQSVTENYNFIGAGLSAGGHWYFLKRFVLEPQIIFAYQNALSHTTTLTNNLTPLYTSNSMDIVFVNLFIGYRF